MAASAAACVAACAAQSELRETAQLAETATQAQSEAQSGTTSTLGSAAAQLPNQDLTRELLYEFLVAEIAGQRGNYALSAQAYTDLAQRTRDPRVAERATEIALIARMYDAAVDAAKVWADGDVTNAKAQLAAATLLARANRLDEAEGYLHKILAQGNRDEAFLQLNGLLGNNPDKATNLKLIQRLAAPYPELAQAHFAIAQAAATAGQDELALGEVRTAARLAPDWELAALYEASLLQKTSNGAATDRLAAFLKSYPQSREIRVAYARTLVAGKKFAEARTEFDRLLKDYPDNTEVLYAVAVLSMQLEDWPGAEGNLKRLLDLGYRDQDSVRLYLGQVVEEQKRFPEAIKWYAEVTQGEQFLPAQIRTAQVMSKQGDLAGARDFLHQIDTTTNQQRVQVVLAETQLLRDANQPKEAFGVVERALDKLPNDPDLLYDRAMLAEKIDRVDILESSLRKLIEIKPDYAHAYNALGYSLADRNERLDEAQELIERALKLAPDDHFIIDSMGWVLYRQGKHAEALKELQRAYAGRPDPEIAAHLGEVLWTLGRKEEALKVWNEALTKTPTNEALVKTVRRLKQ